MAALAFLWCAAAPAGGQQPSGPAQGAQQAESCVACHQALDDERLSSPVASFAADVHAVKGLGCAACHGGDPQAFGPEAMDPAKGFIGRPARREIPQLCGRCHSDAAFMRRYNPSLRVDQVTEYRTSVHGRRLVQFNDPRVATCVSCHRVHAIRPPTDPQSSVHPLKVARTCGACHADSVRMAPYGIPTDQLRRYETSVHWEMMSVKHDLAAPTCNDCHGNHGAAPPGVSWVGNTCGQCHTVMQRLFDQSPHGRVFPQMGVPGCAACHRNHDVQHAGDELLGLGAAAVCSGCHDAESRGGEQAVAMRRLIDSLRVDFDSADGLLRRAERSGVEVSQGLFELQEARNALVGARTAVHASSVDAVRAETEKGFSITARARARGGRALGELRFRRTGLVISVTIILALIVGLVLKIRQLESSSLSQRESP
ncbi:MAG TPA: cytochrome c3 family protein [Gemmatimonadales bacterium]